MGFERAGVGGAVVVGDGAGGGGPDAGMGEDVFHHLDEAPDAVRLADPERVQRDAHHPPLLLALGVDGVKIVADLLGEGVDLLALAPDDDVIEIDRVGHGDEVPFRRADGEGLVVVVEVAGVVEPGLGGAGEGFERVGDGRAEPAALLAAGEFAVDLAGFQHRRHLLLARKIPVVAGVVDAVGHQFPVALLHRLQDRRVVLDHRHREADGGGDAERVGRLEQPPQADAVAVVADGIAEHIGRRAAGPGVPQALEGGLELVVLDVRADPQRDARAIGPGEPGAVQDGRIGNDVGLHAMLHRLPAASVGRGGGVGEC